MRMVRVWLGLAAIAMMLGPVRPSRADIVLPSVPVPPAERQIGNVTVHRIGAIDHAAWDPLTDLQQRQSLATLESNARDAFKQTGFKMSSQETTHFLIYYQHLGPEGSLDQSFANYLEQAYANLAKIFSLHAQGGANDKSQGTNIWRGKAVVYVMGSFLNSPTLLATLHPSMSSHHQVCVTLSGDGTVDIVMYHGDPKGGDYRDTVMAMAVGFLYRLRSPAPLPAWIESGLPMALADSMQYVPLYSDGRAPPPPPMPLAQRVAAADLAIMDLDTLLSEQQPTYPDYSVFESLNGFLLSKNRAGYGGFVEDIKDGRDWKDCVQPRFNMTLDKLESAYRASLPPLR